MKKEQTGAMSHKPHSLQAMLLFNLGVSAAPCLITLVFGGVPDPRLLLRTWVASVVYSTCIGIPVRMIAPRVWAQLCHTGRRLRIAALVAWLALIATVGCFIACGILTFSGYYPAQEFRTHFLLDLRISLLITLSFGAGAMAFRMVHAKLEETLLQLRTKELEHERALKLATEARLSSLESRLNPHFLFNTLNSISSLIRDDPPQAERLVQRMAALLRYTLDSSQSRVIPLPTELKIIEDYLEIERSRFGDRLQFDMYIAEELRSLDVPPLSIQGLVENSVKYAVGRRRSGARIWITAAASPEGALISVCDNGPGFDGYCLKPGHGLDTLQSRLQVLYGEKSKVNLERNANGMAVSFAIPQCVTTAR